MSLQKIAQNIAQPILNPTKYTPSGLDLTTYKLQYLHVDHIAKGGSSYKNKSTALNFLHRCPRW
jgi:hypothetical protein